MKSRDEKAYYAYLEKVIREQKAKSPFFAHGTESHEMDILMLMNHIEKRNPHLMDKILENFIDTTGMENSSKADILAFMAKTDKGTICRWKNEEGEEVYLINNGTNLFKGSKRILVLGNHMNKEDLELFKKSMYGAVLKKDIEHVYKKIERDNLRKQQQKHASIIEMFSEKKEKVLDHSSSNFERNFKALVREQGSTCNSFQTAATMVSLMSGTEKKNLGESFAQMGVRNNNDLERLLSKWKNEALHPEYKVERTRTQTKKTKEVEVRSL